MSNRRDIQFTYNPHNKLTLLDCNFIVDSTNGNGYGVRSLDQGGRIAQVFMNTSASLTGTVATTAAKITSITGAGTSSLQVGMPVQGTGIPAGTTITGILSSTAVSISATPTGNHASESITYQAPGSPNPAAGYIYVILQDNYNKYIGGGAGFVSPVSGTPIDIAGTGVTAGVAYVITAQGTTTQANWQALGLPANMTAAVGVSFIATVTGTGTGTGYVESTVCSGIDHIEVVGDANLMNSNGAYTLGLGNGMQLILACYDDTVLTAPADGTVVGLTFQFNNSAQGV